MITGVVLAREGATYRVNTADGELVAVLRGKLKHQDDDRVVPGDIVELDPSDDGPAAISAIRPRTSVLARRVAAGERMGRRAQPIAANIDQVIIVAAARDPEPNPRMIDRFLVIAESNGLPAVVVLNKIDLSAGAVDVLVQRLGPAGYRVLPTSVRDQDSLVPLRELLQGRASVLTGASGVGKSSLVNAVAPGLKQRIGETNAKSGAGKHTTRAAVLVPLAGLSGGYVVDTPGLREVGTWGVEAEALGACFPEFRPFLGQCRFDNCRHLGEPDCAVRAAAERGEFDPDRLVSYQRLYEEASVPSWSTARRRAPGS